MNYPIANRWEQLVVCLEDGGLEGFVQRAPWRVVFEYWRRRVNLSIQRFAQELPPLSGSTDRSQLLTDNWNMRPEGSVHVGKECLRGLDVQAISNVCCAADTIARDCDCSEYWLAVNR